jgi:hypothetical protein
MVGELGVRARSYFRTDFWGAAAGVRRNVRSEKEGTGVGEKRLSSRCDGGDEEVCQWCRDFDG